MASNLLAKTRVKPWLFDYYLKRLPTPDSLRSSGLFPVFGSSLMRPDHWHPNRHSLALGISLGWFIGLLPVFGFHMPLALLAGILVRSHLPSVPQFLMAVSTGGVFTASVTGILGYAGIRIYLGRRERNIPGWVA